MIDSSSRSWPSLAASATALLLVVVFAGSWAVPASAQGVAPEACMQRISDAVAEINTGTVEDMDGVRRADLALDKAMGRPAIWVLG